MNSKRIFNGLVAALLAIGLVEVASGLILLPFYKPEVQSAYSSTRAIETNAILGVVQALHHWLSSALIVLGGLAVLYGLVSAAYRASSKKLWMGSVLFFVLSLMLQLTGHLLPWDQHAVRTAAVETGIAQNAPLVGSLQANFLRQGTQIGPATLGLWYWAHILLLAAAFVFAGFLLFRKAGAVGISPKAYRIAACVGFALCVLLAVGDRPKVGPQAGAGDFGSFDARPEWYVLPLHTLLNLANGLGQNFAFVGTMVVPGILLILVLAAPWIDAKLGSGKKASYGMVLGILLLAGCGVLSAMSAGNVASPSGPNVAATEAPPPLSQKIDPKLVAEGEKLFAQQGCGSCHTLKGKGGNIGPVLDGTGTRHPSIQWQADHLAKPSSKVSGSTMPAFGWIGQKKIEALAQYLTSLK